MLLTKPLADFTFLEGYLLHTCEPPDPRSLVFVEEAQRRLVVAFEESKVCQRFS